MKKEKEKKRKRERASKRHRIKAQKIALWNEMKKKQKRIR